MFATEPLHLVAIAISHLSLLAQDAPAPEPASPIFQFLNNPMTFVIGIIFIFYFTFIIPEKRRKSEEAKMMSSVKKNSRIVTIGGIHGTVVSTSGDAGVVTIRVDDNTRIKINRTAIAQVIAEKESQEAKNKETAADAKDD